MAASIIRSGWNVRCVSKAENLSFLIDGASYYARLVDAFRLARKEIWIIGWDFDPEIALTPDRQDPHRLQDVLSECLDANPDLVIRVLVWAMGPVYSGKSLKLFRRKGWMAHPRVQVEFDGRHPFSASHHQKIVCIDNALAFIGGIDLTARRWDDSRHAPDNALRVSPDGKPYEPVHDIQAAVSGPAAAEIGDIARRRWKRATRQDVPAAVAEASLWPAGLPVDVAECDVALSLTDPQASTPTRRRQSIHLAHDAIRHARRHIYIEAQYLASFRIADTLAARLAEPDCPEIIIVVTRISHGFLEKVMMGHNRDRLIRRLKQADLGDKLWVMYAVVPDATGQEQEILVHSKLLMIDDDFVRLGSSNLNNRSEGLDSEADIALEAANAADSDAIAQLRHRLLAEHMACSPEEVRESYVRTGSLQGTLNELNKGSRGLRHFDIDVARGPVDAIPGTAIVDPRKPIRPLSVLGVGMRRAASRVLGRFA